MEELANASTVSTPGAIPLMGSVVVADASVTLQPIETAPVHPKHRMTSLTATPELQRALDRLSAGVTRGAAIGLTLRGGLHLVGSLLAALSKSKRRSVTAVGALDDTLRYTAFLGALAGIYISVDEGIAAAVGKERSAKWRSLVAGVCAGPALLLTGSKNRHYSLATYILLRGVTLLIRTGNKQQVRQRRRWLYAVLAPTRFAHGDTALMCAACSQIIYGFIMMPQTLPASYVRFIRKQGAKDLYVWQGIRELAERTGAGRPLSPLNSLIGTPHAHRKGAVPCHFFHPGQSCVEHPLKLFLPAYQRALSVYLPVYVLPALLVHRKQMLQQPLPILQKLLLGIARSSLFLSSFICVAFGGACAGHNITGQSTGTIIAASTWVGGLSTLLEKKSRRMELALYVASRALESFSRCLVDWGWVSPRHVPPRMDTMLFAAGCGAILHCYSGYNGLHRDVFKSKYLNILDFVFGNAGITEGKIKHIPSNQDLLKSVSLRVRSLSYGSLQGMRGQSDSDNNLTTVLEVRSPAARDAAAAEQAAESALSVATAAAEEATTGGESGEPVTAEATAVAVVADDQQQEVVGIGSSHQNSSSSSKMSSLRDSSEARGSSSSGSKLRPTTWPKQKVGMQVDGARNVEWQHQQQGGPDAETGTAAEAFAV